MGETTVFTNFEVAVSNYLTWAAPSPMSDNLKEVLSAVRTCG